jgi:hypothetical protein
VSLSISFWKKKDGVIAVGGRHRQMALRTAPIPEGRGAGSQRHYGMMRAVIDAMTDNDAMNIAVSTP